MRRTTQLSRREFASIVAGGALVTGAAAAATRTPLGQAGALTVGEVIERIKAGLAAPLVKLGGTFEWRTDTVDTLKAGDAATRVTGIVTTALPTITVLRQAVEGGANLIITSQPAFYSRADARTPPAGRGGRGAAEPPPAPPPDPVFTAKNNFITQHNLAIFRLHDHWRDWVFHFNFGLANSLGLPQPGALGRNISRDPSVETTLGALARDVKSRLGLRGGIRVVGNPDTRVRRVGVLAGSTPIAAALALAADVDVIIAGEVREWETTEYIRDVMHAGGRKGLILIGRIVSEEGGMRECAGWLSSTVVPGIPVRHIAAGDPYWRPA